MFNMQCEYNLYIYEGEEGGQGIVGEESRIDTTPTPSLHSQPPNLRRTKYKESVVLVPIVVFDT